VGESGCRQNRPQLLRLDGHLLRQLLLRALPLLRYDSNQPVLSSLYPVASRGRRPATGRWRKKRRRARCCARSGSTAAARAGTWHSWSRRVRLRIRSSYGRFSQRLLVFVQAVPRSERQRGARGWRRGRRGEGGGTRRSGAHARVSSTAVAGGPVCPRAVPPSVLAWFSTNCP
jgi:hypothetical protein